MTEQGRMHKVFKKENRSLFPLIDQVESVIPPYRGFDKKSWEKEEENPKSNYINSHEITSLIISADIDVLNIIEIKLQYNFPNIVVKGKLNCMDRINEWIKDQSPDLVFFDIDFITKKYLNVLDQNNSSLFETILITGKEYAEVTVLQNGISGYLHKPIQENELLKVVQQAKQKIQLRKEHVENKILFEILLSIQSQKNIIGIPTINGYDFLPIEHIIFCEGMQKYTKLITINSDILSSYNIGEFQKLLHPFGFYSPHRSFLINLSKITKYHKEGTLTMCSGHHIPVARRKREPFLYRIKKDSIFPIIYP